MDAFKAFSTFLPSGKSIDACERTNSDFRLLLLLILIACFSLFFFVGIDPNWSVADDTKSSMDEGFLTTKVVGLVELLLDYRFEC